MNFSPYVDGQDPHFNPPVSVGQIQARLQIVAPFTIGARSYSSTHGLENFPSVARALGLKVAAEAWISKNTARNAAEINDLIAAAQAGNIDLAEEEDQRLDQMNLWR